jgi:hypothetical protein
MCGRYPHRYDPAILSCHFLLSAIAPHLVGLRPKRKSSVLSNIERERVPALLEVPNEDLSVGWLDALIDFSRHDRTGLDVFGNFFD